MLSDNQLKHKCLLGAGGRTCRYLVQDPNNWQIHNCVKKLPAAKKIADKSATKYLADCKKKGINPANGWVACGDGGTCPGYLYLPTVKQGYDVK